MPDMDKIALESFIQNLYLKTLSSVSHLSIQQLLNFSIEIKKEEVKDDVPDYSLLDAEPHAEFSDDDNLKVDIHVVE